MCLLLTEMIQSESLLFAAPQKKNNNRRNHLLFVAAQQVNVIELLFVADGSTQERHFGADGNGTV
jgi:hypothetical protein